MIEKLKKITPKQAAKLNIIISLIAAVLMIGMSFIVKDSQMPTYIIIALWLIPFSYLSSIEEKKK